MELPRRKPNRLKNYNYAQNGAYFITICTKDKRKILWNIRDRSNPVVVGARIARPQTATELSNYGITVENTIAKIPIHYPSVSVDKYVIMPNHIHMILKLADDNRRAMRAPTISTVINQMKGYVTKQVGFSIWQKLFHDHVIRSDQKYNEIWHYIDTNPQKWDDDCFYTK